MELEICLWVSRQEAFPYRHDHRRRQMARRVDPQPTHRAKPFFVEIFQRAGDLIDCRPQPIEQTPAGIGDRNAARRTV
jgi:hypothetical protein